MLLFAIIGIKKEHLLERGTQVCIIWLPYAKAQIKSLPSKQAINNIE
jgi:hypothetical protein